MKLGVWSETKARFPSNQTEWMIWTLDAMMTSAKARSNYYRNQDAQLGPLDAYNPKPFPNRNLARMIAMDLVFTLIKSIESFLGVLSVCWKISTNSNDVKTAKRLHRRLLNPGTNTLEEIGVYCNKMKLTGLCYASSVDSRYQMIWILITEKELPSGKYMTRH